MKTTHFAACMLLELGCLVSVTTAGGLRTVALTRDAAPGMDSGVIFSDFEGLVLNDAGQTAFLGELAGTEVVDENRSGIWSEGGGSGLALLARAGSTAPSVSGGVYFRNFNSPILNNAGQTAFSGFLVGEGVDLFVNGAGIWSEGGGSGLTLVARTGNVAPGTDGSSFRLLFRALAFNDMGQIAFFGLLDGTSNTTGVWSEGGGAGLALIARRGNVAPGTGGANFDSKSFGGFSDPVLNNAGQTAFRGLLPGVNVNMEKNMGIWSGGGDSGLTLVARTGDIAPGTVDNANFSSFWGAPVLNNAGQTAFLGVLFDLPNSGLGIWSEGGGAGLALVAREGNTAPGTSGLNFGSLGGPSLNDAGQTAFLGRLTGTGVGNSNDRGIWAEDPSGVLKLIARTGDTLDVDDGLGIDFRTINGLSFAGNGDGRPSNFNNLGQLAFLATFTDGTSGIFVSNLVAIPEPSTLLLGTLAAMAVLLRRRRSCCNTAYLWAGPL